MNGNDYRAPSVPLAELAGRPLFEPVAGWLRHFGAAAPPDAAALNAALASLVPPPCSAAGAPIRFVPPCRSPAGYEERIHATGAVETRPGNWHDFFNALAWLVYPRTKRALNGRHHAALLAQRAAGRGERGALRDAATLFDECGIAVVSAAPELLGLLRAHEWKRLFWTHRGDVARAMRFFVFGHATWDQLRAPFVGLTAKAVFLEVDAAWLAQPFAQQLADVDRRLAKIFSRCDACARPRDFQPLPLLGLPGVVPQSVSAGYYDDTRQFRPRRKEKGPAKAGPEMEAEV